MTSIKTFGEIKEFVRLSFISAKAKKPWGRLNIDPGRLRPNNYEVAKSRRGGGIVYVCDGYGYREVQLDLHRKWKLYCLIDVILKIERDLPNR